MAATFQMNMFQDESSEQQATETPQATPITEKKPKAAKQVEPATAQPRIKAPPVPGNNLTVEEEAKALSDWLNHHAHSYYNLDRPATSDSQYSLLTNGDDPLVDTRRSSFCPYTGLCLEEVHQYIHLRVLLQL